MVVLRFQTPAVTVEMVERVIDELSIVHALKDLLAKFANTVSIVWYPIYLRPTCILPLRAHNIPMMSTDRLSRTLNYIMIQLYSVHRSLVINSFCVLYSITLASASGEIY